MRIAIIIAALALVLASSSVSAKRPAPLPSEQWTPRAHLWLSRGLVAEAGWNAERDHVAIAYVLARRWKARAKRYSYIRFVDIVRAYCTGLEPALHSPTLRQRWLRSLSFNFEQPDAWPRKASWKRHLPLWKAAVYRSEQWARGELRDPCRGKAWHWGGAMDLPKERMVPVDCGDTSNTFYGLVETRQGGSGEEELQEKGSAIGRAERDPVANTEGRDGSG